MAHVVFIGDEVTGAGFRLGGADVFTPTPDTASTVIATAREASDLIIITSEVADWLPEGTLAKLSRASKPLVAVVPDIRETRPAPDMEMAVRRVLGIEG